MNELERAAYVAKMRALGRKGGNATKRVAGGRHLAEISALGVAARRAGQSAEDAALRRRLAGDIA